MSLHRLTAITLGVPTVAPVAAYYEEFGLTPLGEARFATTDGGEQLRLVPAPTRRSAARAWGMLRNDDGSMGRQACHVATSHPATTRWRRPHGSS